MKRKPVNGDRVVCDGRKGTLVDVHQPGKGAAAVWSVLFDDGPKQTITVPEGALTGPTPTCGRCHGAHHAFNCPNQPKEAHHDR